MRDSLFHTLPGPKSGAWHAEITSVTNTFSPTTLLETHSNVNDNRMDVNVILFMFIWCNGGDDVGEGISKIISRYASF